LQEDKKQVVAVYVDKLSSWRITFTYPLLNAARHVMFLVEGEAKAQILNEILVDENRIHPAQRVTARQVLHWYLDEQAASKLKTI
ncbi:MAG: 6-phosphogluconolactonase, partial [Gammaproteobacteria bacterium]|nr:6-phosphogluconolactonase [Gammaproteobacteria bacterium]